MPEDLTPIQAGELTIEPGPAKLATQAMRGRPDFEQMQRCAEMLASSSFTPAHLVWKADHGKTIANCFRVVNQAVLWGLDPFAVADESYVVGGKLAYSGKLVAALVNARAGLKERLKATYRGQGDALEVTISGTFAKEKTPREITLSVAQAKTKNDMWQRRPEQKLFYCAALEWARRHCPELVLGVAVIDELESNPLPITPIEVSTNGTGEDEVIEAPTPEKPAQALPADEERRETLQEAMASEMTAAPAAPVASGFAKKPTGIQAQARAEADLLFTARGLGRTPDDMHKRETIENSWLGKHGAKSWAHLSDEGAAAILKMVREKMAAPGAAPQAPTEKK